MPRFRRAGLAAALAAAPIAFAYRFALVYRIRAGQPRRFPPQYSPTDVGLEYEDATIRSGDLDLPAWFIPANGGAPGPGVVIVHGWESARDRTLPNVLFLNAAGFHCLTFDVRGNGANPAEALPVTGGEYGADAGAAFSRLVERPEVTRGAILGHSMGGVGAILAAAADHRVAALVAASSPADPYRLTRLTFKMANLPLPDVIAYPLAWFTTHVHVHPRRHALNQISATAALVRYRGPVLLAHGEFDEVVPLGHLERLVSAARRGRARTDAGAGEPATVERLVINDGRHSWLHEHPAFRAAVARFLATELGGPLAPDEAASRAVAVDARRLPDLDEQLDAATEVPRGLAAIREIVTGRIRGGPEAEAIATEPALRATAKREALVEEPRLPPAATVAEPAAVPDPAA
jgi:pimeloyl-ACP methyl ester carboxylesterase